MRNALWSATSFVLCACVGVSANAAQFDVAGSSRIQGTGVEALWGAAILSDGTVVVAGSLGDSEPGNVPPVALGNASASSPSGLLHLSADGTEVLGHYRLADVVRDLAIDASDRVYLAAGDAGVLAVDLDSASVAWTEGGYWAHRIDASAEGDVVVLEPDNLADADSAGGSGTIHVYDAGGTVAATFEGHRNTTDVCWAAGQVVILGWRQATAIGNPVQIAYARVADAAGSTQWTAYDWSTDEAADDDLNEPENNMADTRGYRCASFDDKLYLSFEAAGGDHIFRYSPRDVSEPVELVGGDAYHEFYNTGAEHKTVLVVLDAATGDFVTGQQFVARLDAGGGNAVRQRRGGIAVDEAGRVYLTGASASGFPYSEELEGVSVYRGGAYFLAMSSNLADRLYATRATSNGEGHAVAVRTFGRETKMVYVGEHGDGDAFHVHNELPTGPGGGELDGFFTVWNGVMPEPGPMGETDGGASSSSTAGDATGADSQDVDDTGGPSATGDDAPSGASDGSSGNAGASSDEGATGCSCTSGGGTGRFGVLLIGIAAALRRRRS